MLSRAPPFVRVTGVADALGRDWVERAAAEYNRIRGRLQNNFHQKWHPADPCRELMVSTEQGWSVGVGGHEQQARGRGELVGARARGELAQGVGVVHAGRHRRESSKPSRVSNHLEHC